MKVQVKFPLPGRAEGYPDAARQNRKSVREQLLLDSTGSGVEDALFAAAEAAKGPGQDVYVTRGYTAAGRLSVLIVDAEPMSPGDGGLRGKRRALKEALARVTL